MSAKRQGSEASTGLGEFWSECEKIVESEQAIEALSDKDVLVSIQDDTEKASDFLSSLGISNLCPSFSETELDEDLQAILTEGQVATIRRRVDTVRSKKKSVPRKDVRSIFLADNDDLNNINNSNRDKNDHKNNKDDDNDNNKDVDTNNNDNNNNNNNNDTHITSFSTIAINVDEEDEDEDEDDDNDVNSNEKDGGLMDGVVEEREMKEKDFKVNAFRMKSSPSKKDDIGLFVLPHIPFFNKQEHPHSVHAPPTPTLCPDKIDPSIAMEVTRIEDLGRKDRYTLQALAQIELMGVFDKFKVESVQHKSKKKMKTDKEGVFGVRLECLLERDNEGGSCHKVPEFFKQLLSYMEEDFLKVEGILRLSGSFNRIKEIRKEIDATWYNPPSTSLSNQHTTHHSTNTHLNPTLLNINSINPATTTHTSPLTTISHNNITPITNSTTIPTNHTTTHSSTTPKRFSFKDLRANDAVGLMKLFLRDLPSPLLTLQWIDSFIQIAKIPNACMQRYCISLLVLLLPEVNRNTLKTLLSFMKIITAQSHHNRMTEESVCMIMAPNLFLLPHPSLSHTSSGGGGSRVDMERDLKVATSCTTVIQLMLKHLHEMVIVPAGLINQIRQKNHESRKKKQKFWRKDRRLVIKPAYKHMISVHLEPYPDEVSFRLKRHTSVADVINTIVMHSNKMRYNSVKEILRNYCLYEIGGNIEERRLENGTMLSNIIQVNPDAKYVIRHLPPLSPLHPPSLSTPLNQL